MKSTRRHKEVNLSALITSLKRYCIARECCLDMDIVYRVHIRFPQHLNDTIKERIWLQ